MRELPDYHHRPGLFKGSFSGPHLPGFSHFKAGVKCGHGIGMVEGRWNGFVKGLCIGIGLGFAIACLFITCL